MLFHYTAYNKEGKTVEGDGDFQDSAAVLDFLKNQGLTPIKLSAIKTSKSKLKGVLGSPISTVDKLFLTKYLSLMLKVGTDIFKAIDILIADFKKPAVRALLMEIRKNLEAGKPFYTTFANYPRIFSPVFINLIKAGEASGNLEQVFANLSTSLGAERELNSRVRSALTYPALLISASLAILIMLVTFVIPRMASMFMESDMKIPVVTKFIFNVSFFFQANGLWLFGALAVIIVALIIFFRLTKAGRLIFSRLIYKIPLVSDILKKIAYQRFGNTFGSLMRSGLPILENLEITATTVGNEEMKQALLRVAREKIVRGMTLGEAFREEEIFPQTIRTLISIGEKAGHTEEVLSSLSDFYQTEIDNSIKSMMAVFEPVMLLFIGVVVGGIALAVIMPMYQFVGQMGGG
ncbi:MAG TPA: type II secretion system F family protein [Candidatus Paceibacterota bacterium]|nr:type II secretion system F family protein [Candidatus Paceibacterota bacterium]HRY76624.1 type II secretion system F family protein [Candidatus Paceibacterota bacterium]